MLENNIYEETPRLVGEIQGQIIDLGKKEQEKVVEPRAEDVVVLPDDEMKVLSKVTVKGVTADIDKNIKAENIKLGVNILGIEGNVAPDKPDQEKVVNPSTQEQVVVGDVGFELAKVTVRAVDSSIDPNIRPENIKLGTTILGVVGNVEQDKPDQEKTIYPSEEEQIVMADNGFELAKVVAKPVKTESFNVQPSSSEQVIRASDGKWIKEVVVGAVEDIGGDIAEQNILLADLDVLVADLSEPDISEENIRIYKFQDFVPVLSSGGSTLDDDTYIRAEEYLQGKYALIMGG